MIQETVTELLFDARHWDTKMNKKLNFNRLQREIVQSDTQLLSKSEIDGSHEGITNTSYESSEEGEIISRGGCQERLS